MTFNYKDNPLRNDEPHFHNIYFANAYA